MTNNTPNISFDSATGQLRIEGRSYPEDALAFYQPVFDWIDKYCEVPLSETTLTIDTDYLNTTSYKCIIKMLNQLKTIQDSSKQVSVVWFYDDGDDDYKEAGEDLKGITSIPIEIRMK